MARLGMDVDVVERNGAQLQRQAELLLALMNDVERATHHLRSVWDGSKSRQFTEQQWPQCRAHLQRAAEDVAGLGQSALNNAKEQRQTSAATGAGTSGTAPGWLTPIAVPAGVGGGVAALWGQALRSASDRTSIPGQVVGLVGKMAENAEFGSRSSAILRYADAAGMPLGAYSAFTSFYSAFEAGSSGDAFEATVNAGDGTAAALKLTKVGYPYGVVVQTWTEVAREAQKVDWSPQGIQQLRDASFSDWVDAGNEAVFKVALTIPKLLF